MFLVTGPGLKVNRRHSPETAQNVVYSTIIHDMSESASSIFSATHLPSATLMSGWDPDSSDEEYDSDSEDHTSRADYPHPSLLLTSASLTYGSENDENATSRTSQSKAHDSGYVSRINSISPINSTSSSAMSGSIAHSGATGSIHPFRNTYQDTASTAATDPATTSGRSTANFGSVTGGIHLAYLESRDPAVSALADRFEKMASSYDNPAYSSIAYSRNPPLLDVVHGEAVLQELTGLSGNEFTKFKQGMKEQEAMDFMLGGSPPPSTHTPRTSLTSSAAGAGSSSLALAPSDDMLYV